MILSASSLYNVNGRMSDEFEGIRKETVLA
jgi:hypothetical protein